MDPFNAGMVALRCSLPRIGGRKPALDDLEVLAECGGNVADALTLGTQPSGVPCLFPHIAFLLELTAFRGTIPGLIGGGNEWKLTAFAQSSGTPARGILSKHFGKAGQQGRRLPDLLQISLQVSIDDGTDRSPQAIDG